jgi:oxepin-CoA hydrolase/3-oxo-5,6-dehydrosuberyl-CoA semialdehyde dehydrogenase|tara:strand:- start:41 stop:2080 length:2040 start_codon:yes stop_codon:yes gene_type:complete
MIFENYALGKWIKGDGEGISLFNAISGEKIGEASSQGLDFSQMMKYGRKIGGPSLRKMTFQERGLMLKKLALHLHSIKNKFYKVSSYTGATKIDSWIDIEGGIGNVFANASLRKEFPDLPYYIDGKYAKLSQNGTFIGHHIMVPKEGVCIHINAFNFPIWGMLEKISVNLMAGVPAIVKPATLTCYLTELMVREIIASNILPKGSLQLICGSANGILDHATSEDIVTFTGSASTGKKLKANSNLIENSIPFNMEADSLNCSILGKDASPGTTNFDIFIKEVKKEMTVKTGQKCTAIRRIIVPQEYIEDVQIALSKRLDKTIIGDPSIEGVRMGPLAGITQRNEVIEKIQKLKKTQKVVYGNINEFDVIGADKNKGAFIPPILFLNQNPIKNTDCHEIESFGPVATIMPYSDIDQAIKIARMGKGSLVCSIITEDMKIAEKFVLGSASMHGRILILNESCAKESTGHGSPMPLLKHGGPGRAGGGEEMGGKRGILHYLQRTAIQGHPTTITSITKQYQYGAKQDTSGKHTFQRHFEEIKVGDTVITEKHLVTLDDIENFADLSGDRFYAHMDENSLEGTIFTERVAHGYFILSKAAGLFVEPEKGPVLLNYGIDECRFIKPVYPGMTIGVRFTAKEKIIQEKKEDEDYTKGIVKFLVDVYDDENETVMLATILTMIKNKK